MRTAEDVKVKNSGGIIETMRTTPGVFTREVAGAGGTSVNIRGHYANGGNIYLMPEFLAGIDVTRGNVAGTQGFSALAGAANFRTFDVNDVLLPGQNVGGMTSFTYRTNGYRLCAWVQQQRARIVVEVLAALARSASPFETPSAACSSSVTCPIRN